MTKEEVISTIHTLSERDKNLLSELIFEVYLDFYKIQSSAEDFIK